MTTRMDGFRKRSRHKMQKKHSEKGKLSIRNFLQKFDIGDKVYLTVEPAYQNGMYRPKFMGKTGTVSATKGACYEVTITDFKKSKKLIIHPIHLKKAPA